MDFGQRGNLSVNFKALDISLLSMAAIRTEALRSEFRGHEGRMWIYPHDTWDCAPKFETFAQIPNVVSTYLQCVWLYGLCKCRNHVVWLGPDRVYQWRSLLTILAGVKVLKSIVTYALSRLDVHICPRIKMSGAVVLEVFPDDLKVGLGFC